MIQRGILTLTFLFNAGYCAAVGGPVEKRPGRLGRRVQSIQRHQTDQIVRPRAVLLQFGIVETSQHGG